MSKSNHKVAKKQQEIKNLQNALKVLTRKKYTYLDTVGEGSFGIVLKLKSPDAETLIAAKIVSPENSTKEETEFWKMFDHPNVLPLLDVLDTPHKRIFLMPFYHNTLYEALLSDDLCARPDIVKMLQGWLTGVLRGIRYLHSMGVCHLDIKPDNVLATLEPKAVVCDFGYVTSTDTPVHWCGLPYDLRPPEACLSVCTCPEVDGKAFDVWSVGQLAFRLFTRTKRHRYVDLNPFLHGHMEGLNFWPTLIYPQMYSNLQPDQFKHTIKKGFPAFKKRSWKSWQALNLLRCILTYHPVDRPSLSQLEDHVFFNEDTGKWLPGDLMWGTWRCFEAIVAPHISSQALAEIEPSPLPSSVQLPQVHVARRNIFPSYDIAQTHSEPAVSRPRESCADACIQSDSIAARKEFRLDSKVYWDAHEGIFADQPRKKKKAGIWGWMRKKFRGLRNSCSCLGSGGN